MRRQFMFLNIFILNLFGTRTKTAEVMKGNIVAPVLIFPYA